MIAKLQTYPKYKESGLEWLSQIPSGWTTTKLFELYVRKKEYSDNDEELLSVYRDHGVIPKSSRDDNHNKPSEDLSNYLLVKPNNLVINKMKAWQGSVAVSRYRGIVSPAYFTYKLRKIANGKIFLPYLHHLLRSSAYIETYKRISTGIRPAQWDLDPYQFKILLVLLPPYETQRCIADFLDEKTKIIDELVAKKEKMIQLLREKRAALITSTVTKGLDPKARMKPSGIDWLGDIPEGWEVTELHREVIFQNGHGFPNEIQGRDEDEFPFMKVSDINGEQINISSARNYVSDFEVKSRGWNKIPAGSVLTAKIGAALAVNHRKINDIECIIDNNMLAFILRKKSWLHPKYFFMLSKSFDLNWFVNPGAVPSVNMFQLKELIIPVPKKEKQKQITDFLDVETVKIDKIVAFIKSQIDQLKEYRLSLIYSVVTGKVKV